MKRSLSITLNKYSKDSLQPNVSESIDTLVRNFNDLQTLDKWMSLKRTSCLLSDSTISKLLTLSEDMGYPIPRIVSAIIELNSIRVYKGV